MTKSAAALAREWIEHWNAGSPDEIPLAETFYHTSPFGRVGPRDAYMEWVKPMAEKNVADLRIKRIIEDDNQATIHFDMHTPAGVIPVVDWVVVDGGEITEIHSFYDATLLRGSVDDAPTD